VHLDLRIENGRMMKIDLSNWQVISTGVMDEAELY